MSCPNRASQWPRPIAIEVFKTDWRGWGVRATTTIPTGTVVGFFTGKIITRKKALALDEARRARWKRDTASAQSSDTKVLDQRGYIFDIDIEELPDSRNQDDGFRYSVDSWAQGNWTRFINHSCDPVLRVCTVIVDAPEPILGRLAFVAKKKIPAGTELTIDYDPRYTEGAAMKDQEMQPCHCDADSCRGWIKA